MLVKYYGLWDSVAKTLRNTFTCENDEVCIRSVKSIVQDPKADLGSIRDCIVKYLFTMDSENGVIVDIQQRDICTMAQYVDEARELPAVAEQDLKEIKETCSKIITNMKNLIENDKTCDMLLKKFENEISFIKNRLDTYEKKTNDIIGGFIKCQKFKKSRMKK